MTAPKWTRPEPGHNARVFLAARHALSDAQHAGDIEWAARILMQCAADITRQHRWWTRQRPALGVRRERRDAA